MFLHSKSKSTLEIHVHGLSSLMEYTVTVQRHVRLRSAILQQNQEEKGLIAD
jgi:hypothetical protein